MKRRLTSLVARAALLSGALSPVFAVVPAHAQQTPEPPVGDVGDIGDVLGDLGDLVSSPFNLTDLDLLTGELSMLSTQFADTGATDVVVDLVSNDMMAFDTARLADQARRDAEARRRLEAARQAAAGVNYPGVPRPLIEASVAAANTAGQLVPGCRIDAPFLIGNAKSESGSYWDRIKDDGVTRPPLSATEPMAGGDTDGGRLDGRTDRDFAQGIFQFAPATWDGAGGKYGIDGSGDGVEDPQNVFDAALAATWMFCDIAKGADLTSDRGAQIRALGYYTGGSNWQNSSTATRVAQQKYDQAEEYRHGAAGATAAQTTVGPDGCPTSVAANTMRGGTVDVHTLCVRSVAAAPSPEAAQAVKFALRQLGVPYSLPRRNQDGYFDCSSLVTRAYQSAGVPVAPKGTNAPTTHSMLPRSGWSKAPWSIEIGAANARPGDLVFPHEGHVAMVLADNQVVHAPATGDVVHVRRSYSSPLAFRRVDVAKAYANPWRA